MRKRPRPNKRLDAPHVRLYRWMLDCAAYLSLSCQARTVLLEIARGPDGTNNGRLGLGPPCFRTMQHRTRNGSTGLSGTPGPRLCRLHDERSIQPEGTARHRMASDLVELRCHRRTGQQKVHELGSRKTNRG